MSNVKVGCRGLFLEDITEKKKLFIDPDNVFWGLVKKDNGSNLLLPDNLLDLYTLLIRVLSGQPQNHWSAAAGVQSAGMTGAICRRPLSREPIFKW